MRPVYSLNHYICPADLDVLGFLDLAVSYGFVAVGLTERALMEMPAHRLKAELGMRCLGVTSLNSAGHFLNVEADAIVTQTKRNAWLIESAAELGDAPLNVYSGGLGLASGRMTLAEARLRAAFDIGRLNAATQAANVDMVFEPIHPLGIWQRSVFNTLAQSTALIAGMERCSINLDFFHSWWDTDFVTFIEDDTSPLGLVQINDVTHSSPDGTPRRVPLGEGDLPIHALLRSCFRRTVVPNIEVELFSWQLEGRALSEILASTVSFLSDFDEGGV